MAIERSASSPGHVSSRALRVRKLLQCSPTLQRINRQLRQRSQQRSQEICLLSLIRTSTSDNSQYGVTGADALIVG
jgi:hypothetical protein